MIESIAIQNFKSIKDLRLDLRPVNILIGPNGAGKSNFVSFFSFVHAIYNQQLSVYTAERGGAGRILHLGKGEKTKIIGGVINFSNVNKYYFDLQRNDNDNLFFTIEGDLFNRAVYGFKDWAQDVYGRGHDESKLIDLSGIRPKYVKEYIQSFRVYHFHDTSKSGPLKQTAHVNDTRVLRSDGSNLPAFLYSLKQEQARNYNLIEAVIRQIAPFFDRFDLQPNGDFIRLNWRQKGTDMYLDASDLSDGTIRFITLVTLLLQPDPPRTILIDEPELGLHPYAISTLAGLVRSVSIKSQLIVSTQSVELVNQFEPEDIIVVEHRNNESTFNRLNADELADWLEAYSIGDLWQKNVIGGNP